MEQQLPDGLEHVRTTPTFDRDSVPPGLLGTHRVATGVWGKLIVHHGSITFRFEDGDAERYTVKAGDSLVIPPDRPHRVELGDDAVEFAIEFHRPGRGPELS